MKVISWNVNGLRSVLGKNKEGAKCSEGEKNVLEQMILAEEPDILALQETKCAEHLDHALGTYFAYSSLKAGVKKGYSGVAVFSKQVPLRVLDDFEHNEEGRCIVLEYETFFFMNTYTPNAKQGLTRLEYRIQVWEAYVRNYVKKLQEIKPVVFVSDFNCAPTELDIYKVKGHEKSPSFTKEERDAYQLLLTECGLVNVFRHLYPQERKYTWFSHFANSRARNAGWTLDHALITSTLVEKIESYDVLYDYKGSDHCPITISLQL